MQIPLSVTSLLFVLLWMAPLSAHCESSVQFLHRISIERLNRVLTSEVKTFNAPPYPSTYTLPVYSRATCPVDVYRITYSTVIPELGNRPTTASGLIAIPVIPSLKRFPIVSYQHGTVFGKYDVPSYSFDTSNPGGIPQYDSSYEGRLITAAFAGQGYIVIAADYFGLGDSKETEAFGIRASTQQACLDLYKASIEWLTAEKKIQQSDLFIAGWSQGGLNTTGFLEKLESVNIPVTAAATAAGPCDPFALVAGFLFHPRKIDAAWRNILILLSAFSLENYYSSPGLAEEVLNPEHYALCQQLYERRFSTKAEEQRLLGALFDIPVKDLLREKYSDPSYFANSKYGQLLNGMQTYKAQFRTPLTMFWGTEDEAISMPVAKLPFVYQALMFNLRDIITIRRVQGGTHRGTFLTAVAGEKVLFDRLKGRRR